MDEPDLAGASPVDSPKQKHLLVLSPSKYEWVQ